ncbi:DUF4145 domain-containing protein [Phycicoccus jejuensis]|uniref:DUF4145 domain-containing protein n=1 Tax=Phycicoccus jejuensis TaxID=367299 RepID=UPI0004C37126|nr:DUF4145 domain-containing protein [Phycicoccus jejuensis]
MTVDKGVLQLTRPIEEGDQWPRVQCSICGSGRVTFEEPVQHESTSSIAAHRHFAWEPEWIRGSFTVAGRCENPRCGTVFAGAGSYSINYRENREVEYGDDGPHYSGFYQCEVLYPHVLLLTVPESTPPDVQEAIHRAGRVILSDPGLAATALRSGVERFLTHQGVSATDEKGRFVSAAKRIKTWGEAASGRREIARLFDAARWLGNTGTHEDSDITVEEVLQGVTILDEAFHRIYTGPDVDLLAQRINDARGPYRGEEQPKA